MEKYIKSTISENKIPYILNENWKWYKWGEIIESYQQGLIRSNSELDEHNGIEYFKMNFINENGNYSFNGLPKTEASQEEIEKYKIKEGDFFINVRNSKELVGKTCAIYNVDRDILFNHMLVRIKHKDYITGTFINAYFNTKFGKQLLETCKKGTTTVIALYQRDLYDLPIPIPNKNSLKKIDKIYNDINRKIKLLNQLNDNLAQLAKAIYDYWFVQFDFPDENGKPYKSSGGKMVYNEILKREIPEGWKYCTFSDFIRDVKVGDWGKEMMEGNYTEKVNCIRGADLNGLNGNDEIKSPIRYINKKNKSKFLSKNDFIIEISGGSPTQSTGRIALLTDKTFDRFENSIICSNFCKAISLKDDRDAFFFLREWERLYNNDILFSFEGKTSGIKNFLFDAFISSYPIIMPKKEIIQYYSIYSTKIEEKRQENLQQIHHLQSLRDTLLPMLMNRQVEVE